MFTLNFKRLPVLLIALALALALALPITTTHAGEPSPLKMYRTYFAVGNYTQPAEHFKVHTRDSRGLVGWVMVSSNSASEILQLSKDQMRLTGTMPFAEQPEIPAARPTPRRLAALEQAIRQKIKEYSPDKKEIYVSYLGRARKVWLRDIVPMISQALPAGAPEEIRNQPAAVSVHSQFLMYENGDPLSYIEHTYLGGGLAGLDFSRENPLQFVNYQMPKPLEGRSLIDWSDSLFYNRENYNAKDKKIFKNEWKKFSDIARQTVTDIEAGRYQNPIPTLLANQGETFLLLDYAAYGEVDVQFYGRRELAQHQTDISKVVRFNLAKAYTEGGTSVSVNVPELGINGQAVLYLSPNPHDSSPESNRIEFRFGVNHLPDAKTEIFAGLELPAPQSEYENLRILPIAAELLGGWDDQAHRPSRPHGELPGYADYKKIDIYTGRFRMGYKVRPAADCTTILSEGEGRKNRLTSFRRLFSN